MAFSPGDAALLGTAFFVGLDVYTGGLSGLLDLRDLGRTCLQMGLEAAFLAVVLGLMGRRKADVCPPSGSDPGPAGPDRSGSPAGPDGRSRGACAGPGQAFLLQAVLLVLLAALAGTGLTVLAGRIQAAWMAGAAGLTAGTGQAAISASAGAAGEQGGSSLTALYGGLPVWLLVLTGGVIGPIYEEVMVRGVIYPALRDRLGFFPSAACASLLWAVWHRQPAQLLPVFFLGMVLCLLYEVSGRLGLAVLLHAGYNLLVIGMAAAGVLWNGPGTGGRGQGLAELLVPVLASLVCLAWLYQLVYSGRRSRFGR